MKPVDQIVFKEGLGDCVRACVASIFEFPIEEMPNFWEQTQDGATFWRLQNEWLSRERGFRLVPLALNPGYEYLLDGMLCIAVGNTVRSSEVHAVVWKDGLVHDPHPARTGLSGEPEIYVFLIATQDPMAAQPGN